MKEEYIKKSELIDQLNSVIDSLKGFSVNQHPIAYGIRVGFEGIVQNFLEHDDNERMRNFEQLVQENKRRTTPEKKRRKIKA